ncbi:MAG TPA: glycoside hydrolase family 99-like domain-containing protein [Opitutaceae bacterium]|nr:glycoside hydrolase family 99-like domain-containing protein [Opitutaceae bacterium]
MRTPKALAFYLPQFHPIPENDRWWGKGFTEWRNVAKARPRFPGHYQPHIPADLGFYDLRMPEIQAEQAALARQYGIHGFCYYHYWFTGKRLLERPVDQLLRLGQPDFPFCLCWANENWSRTWDGHDKLLLAEQKYSAEDDEAHIRSLIPVFKDPRYIRVKDRPLFLVYRTSHLPDPAATFARWRKIVTAAGLPGLYLANVECFGSEHGLASRYELDAAVEFAPDWHTLPPAVPLLGHSPVQRVLRKLGKSDPARDNQLVFEYPELVKNMLSKPTPSYVRFPCVTPSWDNSARKKAGARIFRGSTPELYESWLNRALARFQPPTPGEDFVFINAWNEWAEGNHLEPCLQWGHGYLEATARALRSAAGQDPLEARVSPVQAGATTVST